MIHQPFLDVKPAPPAADALAANLLVALAYAATGYAGLQLAFVGQVVTLFWPPSGIAFAVIWLGGFRLLPGVALGAFAVNLVAMHGAVPVAALVALGNMLPATLATTALRRRIADDTGELRRVLWFILIAVFVSTMASATIGTLAVVVSGQAIASIRSTWLVWWMGDAMGVMIVAPPILLWRRLWNGDFAWRGLFDAAAFGLAGIGIIAGLWLIDEPIWAVELCKLATLLLSLWAGTRFGLTGPAAITLLMAVGAVAVTAIGAGPFARASFFDSFALVHSYLFAEAIAGTLLAAALADLRRTATAEQAARTEAEAASANRIRLLTMISHDVRTPLAGIMGTLQTLARSRLPPEPDRLVGLGLRAGATLTTLITDILDVARADAGRITLEPAPFSPARSLRDIVDLNRAIAADRGLVIAVTGAETLPPQLFGDRARFEQLFGNLVANAIAYTASGGVTIAATWTTSAPLPLVVEVIDTGPGIDPARIPHLFEAFVLQPGPGNRSAGLGLGLHICHRLTELMAGRIDYRPAPGGGSMFRIALPLPATADSPAAPASPVAEPALHVLLVEDDPIAQEVTAALLRSFGHHVTIAADADAAVAAAAAIVFDLVLMDLQMSGDGHDGAESGRDAARRIRALPGPAGSVAIVALTADALPEQRAACHAAGMDGLLAKPLNIPHGLGGLMLGLRPQARNDGAP